LQFELFALQFLHFLKLLLLVLGEAGRSRSLPLPESRDIRSAVSENNLRGELKPDDKDGDNPKIHRAGKQYPAECILEHQ
jgi:hypothetical protein